MLTIISFCFTGTCRNFHIECLPFSACRQKPVKIPSELRSFQLAGGSPVLIYLANTCKLSLFVVHAPGFQRRTCRTKTTQATSEEMMKTIPIPSATEKPTLRIKLAWLQCRRCSGLLDENKQMHFQNRREGALLKSQLMIKYRSCCSFPICLPKLKSQDLEMITCLK